MLAPWSDVSTFAVAGLLAPSALPAGLAVRTGTVVKEPANPLRLKPPNATNRTLLKIKADDEPCTLKSSPPVVATQHGQLISNLRIATTARGVAAITVHAFENVTIQNVQIQHGAHGGSGIAFSAAHGLTIRNASIALVDASVPAGGPLPTSDAVRTSPLCPACNAPSPASLFFPPLALTSPLPLSSSLSSTSTAPPRSG